MSDQQKTDVANTTAHREKVRFVSGGTECGAADDSREAWARGGVLSPTLRFSDARLKWIWSVSQQ